MPAPPGEGPSPLAAALVYAVLAALWIFFSDRLVSGWFDTPSEIALASTVKGWLFIAVTAIMLYALLRRKATASGEESNLRGARRVKVRIAFATGAVVAVVATVIVLTIARNKQTELTRLDAVVSLKSAEIGLWVKQRIDSTALVAIGDPAAGLYSRWVVQRDATSRKKLLERLENLRALNNFDGITLFNEKGDSVWGSRTDATQASAAYRAEVLDTLGQGARYLTPYADSQGQFHLDFAAPLRGSAVEGTAIVVFHVEQRKFIPPQLQDWPDTGTTGEIELLRKDGNEVVFLNLGREKRIAVGPPGSPGPADSLSLAVQAVSSSIAAKHVFDGVDYRGQRVFGAARTVPGTDWFVIVKMDQAELLDRSMSDISWIILAGLLSLFGISSSIYLAQKRSELVVANATARADQERLGALRLLSAIADGSSDAIFAKDDAGYYNLWNKGAEQLTGMVAAEVVGRDDSAIFPADQIAMLRQNDQKVMRDNRVLTFEETLSTPAGLRTFLATKGPLHDEAARVSGLFGISRDITELKQSAVILARLNRALRYISECTQSIVHSTDESSLLQAVCRIAVESGGYRMAWIGYAQQDVAKTVSVAAKAGFEEGYVSAGRFSWDDNQYGRGPLGTCIRERRAVWNRDFDDSPLMTPWRDEALKRGYRAAIALPLLPDETSCLGALVMYSADPDAFDSDEVRLLFDLANDLAFGIRALRETASRHMAEEALREEALRLAESQRIAGVGSWSYDYTNNEVAWSDETYVLYGVHRDSFNPSLGSCLRMIHADDREPLKAWLNTLSAGNPDADEFKFRVIRPDGDERILVGRATVETDAYHRPLRARGTQQDVTERDRAESIRHEQEARYRDMFDANPNPMWVFDQETLAFVTVNDAAVRAYGYSRAEFLAMTILDIRSPETIPELTKHLARQNQEFGDTHTWEHRRKDGSPFLAEITSHAMMFGGRASRVVLAHDVTVRVQAEAALAESERNFRSIAEHMPAMIYRVSLEQNRTITYLSPAVKEFGYDPAEWMGRSWQQWVEAVHPDDRQRVLHELAACEHLTGVRTTDYRMKAGDGTWHVLHNVLEVFRDDADVALHVQGVAIDVTERIAAEAQLRQLSQAIEQSTESMVITNTDAEIEYVNSAFLNASGYTRDEVIGRNPRILSSGKTPRESYQSMWAALTAGKPWKGELSNKRKDGSEYVEFAHIAPVRDRDGRISHYLAIKEDITQRKQLAVELDRYRSNLELMVAERTRQLTEAQAQAEAANRAKSDFLANMSHEIRTPMNAIVGLTYLIRRDALVPQQLRRLDQIDTASRHLLAIINDILDLSKIEAGKISLEHSDFHLSSVLDNVRSVIAESARAKGIAIEVDSDSVPLWLRGDPTRLRQALLNYAGNAVKFTPAGTIWLRARLISQSDGALIVRFEVQDTGIGIAADVLDRLFQPFEQAESSTSRKFGGTGLGLAITRRLSAIMGGEAGAYSEPGGGSTFWFTARMERGHGVVPASTDVEVVGAEHELRANYSGARVLLAEDNAINREVALELLHATGLEVETAGNGREAVEKVQTQRYDLVLMDVQMPEMGGIEATRAIRALPQFGAVPIVAMTANAFDDDRRACLAAGMNDFVAKPVDPANLYRTLLRWLPKRSGTSAAMPAVAAVESEETPDDSETMSVLSQIAGLDPARGISVLRGDAKAYARLLQRLVADHVDDSSQLTNKITGGQHDAAREIVHTLKGAAATLGAVQLQAAAAALETALREGHPEAELGALLVALASELGSLRKGLDRLPGKAFKQTDRSVPDPTRTHTVLVELEPLLTIDDTEAQALFLAHQAVLEATLGPVAIMLGEQIQRFDYPGALATLREIIQENAGPGSSAESLKGDFGAS